MHIAVTDVKNFFLQARLPEKKEYYAEIPPGWEEGEPGVNVAKVLAPWYGLPEAAKVAGDQLAKALEEAGMMENPWLPKVFFKWEGEDLTMCATHIDDAPWMFTNPDKFQKTLDKIQKRFELVVNMNPERILGCELEYDRKKGIMKLHQGTFNKDRYHQNKGWKPARSPGYIPTVVHNPESGSESKVQATPEQIREFQKRVGALNWTRQTDATVGYAVSRVGWAMLNPQKQDWHALDRIERYKATHPEIGPVWRRADPPEKLKPGVSLDCLTTFADADLAGCKGTSKSYDGFCLFLGNSGMFDWSCKRQTCVAQSSCESETNTAKSATNHVVWLRNGLSYMNFSFTKPSPICQDNQSAIALCESDKHHSRTRHFRIHVAVLKDAYERRITWYPWVPTKYMRGDLFNKLHQPIDHERLSLQCGMTNTPISHLPDKGEPFEIHDWLEKVRKENSEAAAKKPVKVKKIED